MKSFKLLMLFLGLFIFLFVFCSFVACIFSELSFVEIARNNTWQIIYSMFIGWIPSLIITMEYNEQSSS